MPGKRKIVALMLTLLLALALLSGCGGMLKNETLEKQLDIIVTAMNTDDEDLLYNAFYPGMSRVNFDDSYKEMQAFWEGSGEYTKEPVNINITSGNGTKVYEGEYVVAFEEKSYIVTLAYVEDEGGKGLRNVHFREGGMESVSDAVVSGSFRTAGKNSPAQWGLLALTVAEWGFVLFTLVDIFRKKPKLYGLWAVLALFAISLAFTFGGVNGFRFSFGHILTGSRWAVYGSGARELYLMIPVGALSYWCARKGLLAEKEDAISPYSDTMPEKSEDLGKNEDPKMDEDRE